METGTQPGNTVSIISAQLIGFSRQAGRRLSSPRSPFRCPSPSKLIDECVARRFAGRRGDRAIRHSGKQGGKRSRKRYIVVYPVAVISTREQAQSSRPATREAGRRTGSGTQPKRSDETHGEAERWQIVSATAAEMMGPTGYDGTMDAPDMRHEGREELQKKSLEIVLGIF